MPGPHAAEHGPHGPQSDHPPSIVRRQLPLTGPKDPLLHTALNWPVHTAGQSPLLVCPSETDGKVMLPHCCVVITFGGHIPQGMFTVHFSPHPVSLPGKLRPHTAKSSGLQTLLH